jgi:hypothetical protein
MERRLGLEARRRAAPSPREMQAHYAAGREQAFLGLRLIPTGGRTSPACHRRRGEASHRATASPSGRGLGSCARSSRSDGLRRWPTAQRVRVAPRQRPRPLARGARRAGFLGRHALRRRETGRARRGHVLVGRRHHDPERYGIRPRRRCAPDDDLHGPAGPHAVPPAGGPPLHPEGGQGHGAAPGCLGRGDHRRGDREGRVRPRQRRRRTDAVLRDRRDAGPPAR